MKASVACRTGVACSLISFVGFAAEGPERSRIPVVATVQVPPPSPGSNGLQSLWANPADVDSSVPVLLPPSSIDGPLLVENVYYAVQFNHGGTAAGLEGTRLEYPASAPNASATPSRNAASLEEGEGFTSLSWGEFGAAYMLTLECTGCEVRIRALAKSLTYVGGGRRMPTPIAQEVGAQTESMPAPEFNYEPPGSLEPNSGRGVPGATVYAPDMRFPLESRPAFANSQVYRPGGQYGGDGGQCDPKNYSYPWRDNFCEHRPGMLNRSCLSRTGHQGQDIRPATCQKDLHRAVACVDGRITFKGAYKTSLTGSDGTTYNYLHLSNVAVRVGDYVRSGDPIGLVSDQFGGTPTTIHLHFEVLQNIKGLIRPVPPYSSLVDSYKRLP